MLERVEKGFHSTCVGTQWASLNGSWLKIEKVREQKSDQAYPGGPGKSVVYLQSNGETIEGC